MRVKLHSDMIMRNNHDIKFSYVILFFLQKGSFSAFCQGQTIPFLYNLATFRYVERVYGKTNGLTTNIDCSS